MVWVVVCGFCIVMLAAYGAGCSITGEDGWVALGVGLVVVIILCSLFGGLMYGLHELGAQS